MTEKRKIDMLRTMIDDRDEDEEVLSVYLELAAGKILNRMYPYKEDYDGLSVPDRYAMVQLKAAAYMYLKQGAEGQIQHIEGQIHRNYGSADIPNDMLAEIVPYAQAIR